MLKKVFGSEEWPPSRSSHRRNSACLGLGQGKVRKELGPGICLRLPLYPFSPLVSHFILPYDRRPKAFRTGYMRCSASKNVLLRSSCLALTPKHSGPLNPLKLQMIPADTMHSSAPSMLRSSAHDGRRASMHPSISMHAEMLDMYNRAGITIAMADHETHMWERNPLFIAGASISSSTQTTL